MSYSPNLLYIVPIFRDLLVYSFSNASKANDFHNHVKGKLKVFLILPVLEFTYLISMTMFY